jgi:hypothetical protein
VSILRRMTSHLDDAAFAEMWTNALAEGHDVTTHPHLQVCAECRVRFASFSQWMTDIRVDAIDEADEQMPAERLAAQQAQIFRRLEAAERPARVIAFPKSSDGAMRRTPVHRWVAAAAAAGLVAGLGLGQMFDLRHWSPSSARVVRSERVEPSTAAVQPRPAVLPASLNDEATLADLEAAATPRYEALRAYDTFTPRAADFIQPR